jgi:hypothetical protein
LIRGLHLKNITATDFSLNCPAVKSLGLHYRRFDAPLPLFKRLGGRFTPKNCPFWHRVEKVGLTTSNLYLEFRNIRPAGPGDTERGRQHRAGESRRVAPAHVHDPVLRLAGAADLLDSFGVPTVRVDTDVSEAKACAYILQR